MAKQLFGTDGIRGVAGEYPLDARTVYAVGAALARRLAPRSGPAVLIGMDTRQSGLELAELLAAGLADDGGAGVRFAGVMPTAAVSFLVEREACAAGVMISASHNPFEDNGIKVFGPNGFKIPDEVEHEIEELIFKLAGGELSPRRLPLAVDENLERHYLEHLLQAGPPPAELRRLRVIADCSNGAACRGAEAFFRELGMDVEITAAQPDGRNINLDCGSLHLEKLQALVVDRGADLGVAFDGDADRALFVADDGQPVDGDGILLLAGRHLKASGRLPGDLVVTTVMANMGLEAALNEAGIRMARTKVGDKYVLEQMVASGATLGGEQSGHVIFREHANTGDGLLTARVMLEILGAAQEPLSVLRRQLKVFPQKLVNVRVKSKPPIEDAPALAAAVRRSEAELNGRGRIVVRYSGTEPLARVMVEAENAADVEAHCTRLAAVFEQEIGISAR